MDFSAAPGPGAVALPVACEFTEDELAARAASGIPPESADEYLARGRLEAKLLGSVVVAADVGPGSDGGGGVDEHEHDAQEARGTQAPAQGAAATNAHEHHHHNRDHHHHHDANHVRRKRKWAAPADIAPWFHGIPDQWRTNCVREFKRARRWAKAWREKLAADEANDDDNKGEDVPQLPRVAFPTEAPGRLQWLEFCFGPAVNSNAAADDDAAASDAPTPTPAPLPLKRTGGTPPLAHVVLQMDQVQVARVLRHISNAASSDGEFDDRRSAWTFSLLAVLETPTTPDVSGALRNMLRVLATISLQHPNSRPACNLVCCLLEDVFGQGDVTFV